MTKHANRLNRHLRVRKKIIGSQIKPRLSVFRSNQHIYAQLIDDSKSVTLAFTSDLSKSKKLENKSNQKGAKLEKAKTIGLELAKIAISKKIKKVVFDRSGYKYHGRVKAVAEGAREGGLEF